MLYLFMSAYIFLYDVHLKIFNTSIFQNCIFLCTFFEKLVEMLSEMEIVSVSLAVLSDRLSCAVIFRFRIFFEISCISSATHCVCVCVCVVCVCVYLFVFNNRGQPLNGYYLPALLFLQFRI